MSLLNPTIAGDSIRFNRNECAELGKKFKSGYESAMPFPHIVLDDFLPVDLLRRVLEEFPAREAGRFTDVQSNLKTGYQLDKIRSSLVTNLMYAFNSAQFLPFLEEVTGISQLLPDPYYVGGGLHETARGGHLSIHVDFNMHPRFRLRRRMNLILFLNEDWKDEYGGHLELWNRDMKSRAKAILPEMGRAVLFNTDEGSYHGHPDPLNCPEDRFRRSIALYYYTAPTDSLAVKRRTTQFQVRPGSRDKSQYGVRLRELFDDFCPPILLRLVRGR